MSWTKKVDRRKFPCDAWVMCSWNSSARKWFCALFPKAGTTALPPIAAGQGDDPLEAVLAMCIDLDALSESGEWKS